MATFCFLQHENEIRVPELVKYGGNIQFEDEFALKWFYLKLIFFSLSLILYITCFISYGIEYGFKWWFTYYEYLNFTFFIIYLFLSLIITLRIYRYIKNNQLPYCLQTAKPFQLTTDNEDELEDINNNNDNNHRQNRDDDDDVEINSFFKNISVEQLKSSILGKFVLFFQYISLNGLWTGCILYWMHEFEINVFKTDTSSSMQLVIIVSLFIVQIIASIDFFMSGFRLKYSGFIWSLLIMIIIIIINMIQILENDLNKYDYDQHLFTELDWKNNVEPALVTCFWSMAILLIVNTSLTFLKNICLCKWSIKQRRAQRYPRAQEVGHEVEI